MNISNKANLVFNTVNNITRIIFLGLCIKTGAMIFSFVVSIGVNEVAAKDLYRGLNLYDLYLFNKVHYILMVLSIILQTGLKAFIAYILVKLFMDFKLTNPFNQDVSAFLNKISFISFVMGLLSIISMYASKWFAKNGVSIEYDWGASEILFFSGVMYIIAEVFKRGAEMKLENDLTI